MPSSARTLAPPRRPSEQPSMIQNPSVLQRTNLQQRLPEILSPQHLDKPFPSIINPLRHAHLNLERPIVNPLLQIFLMRLGILGAQLADLDVRQQIILNKVLRWQE